MAKSSYDDSLARLLEHEGGYTNHPADPGGPTNFGGMVSDPEDLTPRTPPDRRP